MSWDLQTQLMSERLMKHRMWHQYRSSGGKGVHEYPAPGDTSGIAWNVPSEHRGNGNNKQQHYNAPQNKDFDRNHLKGGVELQGDNRYILTD
ncbi:hypothetical protein E2C01_018613 [Portunus trituberculatus]|uniref:Uncharacterized protein n=1 Tax=Portunus trituberculatus TaxID=210409 RepID=A0A5B7DWX0_PORTR|nr:hypothetical protein [Portunus trituberculatus]